MRERLSLSSSCDQLPERPSVDASIPRMTGARVLASSPILFHCRTTLPFRGRSTYLFQQRHAAESGSGPRWRWAWGPVANLTAVGGAVWHESMVRRDFRSAIRCSTGVDGVL